MREREEKRMSQGRRSMTVVVMMMMMLLIVCHSVMVIRHVNAAKDRTIQDAVMHIQGGKAFKEVLKSDAFLEANCSMFILIDMDTQEDPQMHDLKLALLREYDLARKAYSFAIESNPSSSMEVIFAVLEFVKDKETYEVFQLLGVMSWPAMLLFKPGSSLGSSEIVPFDFHDEKYSFPESGGRSFIEFLIQVEEITNLPNLDSAEIIEAMNRENPSIAENLKSISADYQFTLVIAACLCVLVLGFLVIRKFLRGFDGDYVRRKRGILIMVTMLDEGVDFFFDNILLSKYFYCFLSVLVMVFATSGFFFSIIQGMPLYGINQRTGLINFSFMQHPRGQNMMEGFIMVGHYLVLAVTIITLTQVTPLFSSEKTRRTIGYVASSVIFATILNFLSIVNWKMPIRSRIVI